MDGKVRQRAKVKTILSVRFSPKVCEHQSGERGTHVSVGSRFEHGEEHESELWEGEQTKTRGEVGGRQNTEVRSGGPGSQHNTQRAGTRTACYNKAFGSRTQALQGEGNCQVVGIRRSVR